MFGRGSVSVSTALYRGSALRDIRQDYGRINAKEMPEDVAGRTA
jgi:hypothetical protein